MNNHMILISWPDSPAAWAMLIAAIAVVVVALAIPLIVTVVKLVRNGQLDQLRDAVVAAIKEAEKSHASGEEKKKIAMDVIKAFCEKAGIKLNEKMLSWAADYIEKFIRDHNELELIEEEEGR